MGFLQYSETELRDLLSRTVKARWPSERMLLVTPCSAERLTLHLDATPGPLDVPTIAGGAVDAPLPPREDGVIAVTQARLIYQQRTAHAAMLHGLSAALGASAVIALFVGRGLGGFLALATAAVAVWFGPKLAELATTGTTSVSFANVEAIDHSGQRIQGMARTGALYRLRIPDPSDFRLVTALVTENGAANAA